jgi:hypothetical protein
MSSAYVVVLYRRFYLNLKLSSAKLSYFCDSRRDGLFGAIVYLLEPKGGGGGRSVHGDLSLFRHRIRICEKISARTFS